MKRRKNPAPPAGLSWDFTDEAEEELYSIEPHPKRVEVAKAIQAYADTGEGFVFELVGTVVDQLKRALARRGVSKARAVRVAFLFTEDRAYAALLLVWFAPGDRWEGWMQIARIAATSGTPPPRKPRPGPKPKHLRRV